MGTRKDLRERFRVRMGFPEDTATGNGRFNAALNSALRHLWSDLPDVLLTEEFRFHTEPPFEGGTIQPYYDVTGGGTYQDALVMVRNETTGTLPNSKELRGRWLEIYDGTNYHLRRIQEHFTADYTAHGGATGTITGADHFVIDKPWVNTSDRSLSFRILTLEYPYPADIQKITHLIYSPENSGVNVVMPMLRGDHDRWRKSVGWRADGTPQAWARGDFFQLPAPRYTPGATVENILSPTGDPDTIVEGAADGGDVGKDVGDVGDTTKNGINKVGKGKITIQKSAYFSGTLSGSDNIWGYSSDGTTQTSHGTSSLPSPYTIATDTVQPKYGAAGTFSYRVVHVWGRRPDAPPMKHADISTGDERLGERAAWYISAASSPTPETTTFWGEGAIAVKTPNVDISNGYNPDITKPSYHKYGVEKWIFRARHRTEDITSGQDAPVEPEVPADGVYYLWAIRPGYETVYYDRGQHDPPDRKMSLEAWSGHQSIRFDRLPNSTDTVLIQGVSRPPQLHHDNDAPRVPEECLDCLFALCASYLSGDRDGSMERKQLYFTEYVEHKRRLIRLMGIETAMMPEFGDGLGMSTHGIWESAGQTVKEA